MSLEMFAPTPAAPAPQQQPAANPPPQQQPAPVQVDQPDVDLDALATDVQGGDQQPSAGRSIEDRARDMGWEDRESFRGDPSKWRPASEFVQRAYDEPRIAQSMLAKLESRNEQLEAEFNKRLRGLERMQEASLARQRDQMVAQFDSAMRDAAAVGDLDKFDKLQASKREALKDHSLSVAEQRWNEDRESQPQRRQESGGDRLSSVERAEVSEWIEANPWVRTDEVMASTANALSKQIQRTHPGLTAAQNLAEVTKQIRTRFPERFKTRQSPGSALVEGGSRVAGGGAPRTLFSTLPREAQAEAMRAVKSGAYRNVEDWAIVYNEGSR